MNPAHNSKQRRSPSSRSTNTEERVKATDLAKGPTTYGKSGEGVHAAEQAEQSPTMTEFLHNRVHELQRLLSESERTRKDERHQLMNEHWARVRTMEETFRGREEELSRISAAFAELQTQYHSLQVDLQCHRDRCTQQEQHIREITQQFEQTTNLAEDLKKRLTGKEHEIQLLRSQVEDKETIIRMQKDILESRRIQHHEDAGHSPRHVATPQSSELPSHRTSLRSLSTLERTLQQSTDSRFNFLSEKTQMGEKVILPPPKYYELSGLSHANRTLMEQQHDASVLRSTAKDLHNHAQTASQGFDGAQKSPRNTSSSPSSIRVHIATSLTKTPNDRIAELRHQLEIARKEREHTQCSRLNRSRSHSSM